MPSIEELKAAAEKFSNPEPRKVATPEGDLKNVMAQIKQLESEAQAAGDSGSPSSGDSGNPAAQVQSSPTPPPPCDEAAALPSPSPAAPGPAPSRDPRDYMPTTTTPEGLVIGLPQLPIPKRSPAPDWLHSIVEVVSKEGHYYGVLFRLGDIKAGKAHGYIIKENGHREFITVPADHIEIRAVPKVKAKDCCSGQWMSEHKP